MMGRNAPEGAINWRPTIDEHADIVRRLDAVVQIAVARQDLTNDEALPLWKRLRECCAVAQQIGDAMEDDFADIELIKDFESIEGLYIALHNLIGGCLATVDSSGEQSTGKWH
jgi:hypothetical protein